MQLRSPPRQDRGRIVAEILEASEDGGLLGDQRRQQFSDGAIVAKAA
jgi:hypothetical protein